MNLSPENSFGESHFQSLVRLKTLRARNALQAFTVYPVFEDEKSNGSDEKSVERKIALKRPHDLYNCYKLYLRAINQSEQGH